MRQDRRANPVIGVRREAHTATRIVFVQGAHHTEIALRDQVTQGQAVAAIGQRDGDYVSKLGMCELFGRSAIALLRPAQRQLVLLVHIEARSKPCSGKE